MTSDASVPPLTTPSFRLFASAVAFASVLLVRSGTVTFSSSLLLEETTSVLLEDDAELEEAAVGPFPPTMPAACAIK